MENNLGQVVLVKDINPGTDNYDNINSSYPSNLIEFNNRLYFSANDGETGDELLATLNGVNTEQLTAHDFL